MRTLKKTKATLGLLSLCFLSGLIAFSKTYFSSILEDVQGLQEVSPRMIFPQRTLPERELIDAQVQFGFNLFSTLEKTNQTQNIFISPTSVALSLSMLYNGATGSTQEEIAKILNIKGVNIDTLNRANHALETDLNTHDSSNQFLTANSLWAREGLSFRYQFLKDNRSYYQAQITNLNFANSEARGIINRWVTEETQGKIKEIINKTQGDDVLFLMNTAYFQGTWQTGFDKTLIKNKPFHLINKSVKNYPFLSRQGSYNYTENSQLKALDLPYGDGRFSLYVLLPKSENSLRNIVKELTVKKWRKLLSKFQETEGLLELPRFTLNYEVDLTHSLKSLGLSTMFEPSQANFSALSSQPTYVNGIKHQTFLEINEQGIKSPSKDNLTIETASVINSQPQFSFVVDRPFFCIIQDNETGNILFMGMIFEP